MSKNKKSNMLVKDNDGGLMALELASDISNDKSITDYTAAIMNKHLSQVYLVNNIKNENGNAVYLMNDDMVLPVFGMKMEDMELYLERVIDSDTAKIIAGWVKILTNPQNVFYYLIKSQFIGEEIEVGITIGILMGDKVVHSIITYNLMTNNISVIIKKGE